MILATRQIDTPGPGQRDGELLLVDSENSRAIVVEEFPSLRVAIELWHESRPRLEILSEKLTSGRAEKIFPLNESSCLAPLPRSWGFLDGSAFLEHVRLARAARDASPPDDLETMPLMYQGVSSTFLPWNNEVQLLDRDFGLDFEAEVGVVVTDVPQGVSAEDGAQYIALVVLLNDWTYRELVPREMGTGFGFLQSKPPCSVAPFAITPDELDECWREGRPSFTVESVLNGTLVGDPEVSEMHFSFGELISHATRTRPLHAGTIIGSGTVANQDPSRGSSCLAEKRMREQHATGKVNTAYLQIGDNVEIRGLVKGNSKFGSIRQKIIASKQTKYRN